MSIADSFAVLAIVLAFTYVGWLIIAILNGMTIPVLKWKIPSIFGNFTFPPLFGMIIMGMIARNIHSYMDHYEDEWGKYIRMTWLTIILCNGGMELSFKGKGITVVLLTFCPQIVEAFTVAGLTYVLYEMPFFLCVSWGFVVGAVSPGVLVPSCMKLQRAGYGIKKEIPTTLIAAASFDDIVAIIMFGIFSEMEFNKVGTDKVDPIESVGHNILQIVVGVIVGFAVGALLGVSLSKLKDKKWRFLKLGLLLACLILFITASELIEFHESLFICVLFFGYMLNVFWGHSKPEKQLNSVWNFMQPFLFGSIGAAIKISDVEMSLIPLALVVLFGAIITRSLAAYCCVWKKSFTVKERLVCVAAWIPKATVQAAIGGLVLDRARDEIHDEDTKNEYIGYGYKILTTAILVILITAPLGAILTENLGKKWLTQWEVDENGKIIGKAQIAPIEEAKSVDKERKSGEGDEWRDEFTMRRMAEDEEQRSPDWVLPPITNHNKLGAKKGSQESSNELMAKDLLFSKTTAGMESPSASLRHDNHNDSHGENPPPEFRIGLQEADSKEEEEE